MYQLNKHGIVIPLNGAVPVSLIELYYRAQYKNLMKSNC